MIGLTEVNMFRNTEYKGLRKVYEFDRVDQLRKQLKMRYSENFITRNQYVDIKEEKNLKVYQIIENKSIFTIKIHTFNALSNQVDESSQHEDDSSSSDIDQERFSNANPKRSFYVNLERLSNVIPDNSSSNVIPESSSYVNPENPHDGSSKISSDVKKKKPRKPKGNVQKDKSMNDKKSKGCKPKKFENVLSSVNNNVGGNNEEELPNNTNNTSGKNNF
jgi:hypothetical protein